MARIYKATANGSVTSAKTCLLQIAGANAAGKYNFRVLRCWIEAGANGGLVSAQAQRVQYGICTAANKGTSMTANTPADVDQVNATTPQSTVTTWAGGQADPASVTVLEEHGFDQRAGAGYLDLPTPKEIWAIPNDHAFVVVFPGGIQATTTLSWGVTFEEGGD